MYECILFHSNLNEPAYLPQISNLPLLSRKEVGKQSQLAWARISIGTVQRGHLAIRYRYFWVNATCTIPFTSKKYEVFCHSEWQNVRTGRWYFNDIYPFNNECQGKHFTCVPDVPMELNGQGIPGTHADIQCVPPIAPNPMWIPTEKNNAFTTCGPDMKLPLHIPHVDPIFVPPSPAAGENYLLSQFIEYYGGGLFKAPKLYILDKTSKFFKSWRRGEVAKADMTSTEFVVERGDHRVLKFCVDVGKGLSRSLIMHFAAFPMGSL